MKGGQVSFKANLHRMIGAYYKRINHGRFDFRTLKNSFYFHQYYRRAQELYDGICHLIVDGATNDESLKARVKKAVIAVQRHHKLPFRKNMIVGIQRLDGPDGLEGARKYTISSRLWLPKSYYNS